MFALIVIIVTCQRGCPQAPATVTAICHESWGSRPPLSLLQSSFLPFPLVDSPGGLGRARSPAAKHFDVILCNQTKHSLDVDDIDV